MSSALATTIVFVLAAGTLMARHARRSTPAVPALRKCPRCAVALRDDARTCAGCGAPLQVFELATIAPAAAGGIATPGKRPHAVIRADLCVGCGGCASACPHPGAMTIRGKLAVVDLALCTGEALCVQACPTGAIVLSTGGAVHRVEVPDVAATFETNVPGVFIVGELGGRGLIKNAINEGRVAIEHIARERPAGGNIDDQNRDAYDVVIVGSGPAGLSAALEAKARGLSAIVLEQGTIADTVRKYPRHKFLLAEPLTVPLYGNLWVADASKETLLGVWQNVVERAQLDVRTFTRVLDITRRGPVFLIETTTGPYAGRRVVLALGRRGTPRRLEVPGEELPKVVYDVAEMEEFAGRRVLVVGGGDSAVESALGLANQRGTVVTLSYRGRNFERVKERNLAVLSAAVAAGKIDLLLLSRVVSIEDGLVRLNVECTEREILNDDVIVRIGGEPPYPLLTRIGVRMVHKDLPIGAMERRAG